MPPPFFIVGASRSGTTMLRLILNAHPRLAVPQELKYFNTVARHTDLEHWHDLNLSEREYRDLVRAFLERRRHVFEDIGLDALERAIIGDSERTLRAPYRIAAEAWARHYDKPRWGEKTPRNLFYADLLVAMFPEARFIYVARDPRAVVASMNRIAYFSDDSVLNALNVRRAMVDGYTQFQRSVPAPQRVAVRYEDLVDDPERWTSTLCAFLGEPFEPQMLAFHDGAAAYMDPVIRTPAVTRPVTSAHAEKWRQTLTAPEVATVEAVCGASMDAWEYEPTGAALPLAGRIDRAVKGAYWTWKGWQHRDQRGYAVHYPALHGARARLRSLLP